MSIKGDFGRLTGLLAKLRDLTGEGPYTALNKNLAEESLYQVRQEFRRQGDPYDDPWSPLKYRRGRALRDTGRLANGFSRVAVSRAGFVIANSTRYASVHQHGARYTAGAGSTGRNRRGRFVAAAKMLTPKTKKLRKGYSQVSHGAHAVAIPARVMLPTQARGLGGRWTAALARVTRATIRKLLPG